MYSITGGCKVQLGGLQYNGGAYSITGGLTV